MREYQRLLLERLEQHGWQLEEIRHPEDWWAAEVWVLASQREQHGLLVFCTFIVDPQSGLPRDIASVHEIAFTLEPLSNWQCSETAIAKLHPCRREYPGDLQAALEKLHLIRRNGPHPV